MVMIKNGTEQVYNQNAMLSEVHEFQLAVCGDVKIE